MDLQSQCEENVRAIEKDIQTLFQALPKRRGLQLLHPMVAVEVAAKKWVFARELIRIITSPTGTFDDATAETAMELLSRLVL